MPATTRRQQPKLLDEVRTRLRLHHYSIHTDRSYVDWIVRFVRFHDYKRVLKHAPQGSIAAVRADRKGTVPVVMTREVIPHFRYQ